MKRVGLCLALITAYGCGGSDTGANPPPPTVLIGFASPSGDQQVAAAGTALNQPLRVIVTRSGAPAAGESVTWRTPNGMIAPAEVTTGADGIASAAWVLGGVAGLQTANAQAGSSGGPIASFSALGAVTIAGSQVTVDMFTAGSARFEPAAVIVAPGTTVSWVWRDGSHNILSIGTPTFPDDPVSAPTPRTYQFTFNTPGTYRYYCSEHGTPTSGMYGVVIVQ